MNTGQCLCAEIKFQVEGETRWVGACHCRMCQRQGGGAFQVWALFYADNFKIMAGQVKKFQSSPNVMRSSCPSCSSHLFFQYLDNSKDIYVAAPAMDGPDIKPQEHIWWDSKLSWLCLNDGIEARGN